MKTLRLIVATRLAFFPLIFNLSIAQEVEIIPENYVISTLNEVNEEKSTEQVDGDTQMDFSAMPRNNNKNTQNSSLNAQNDKDIQESKIIVPLYEKGYGEAEGIFSDCEFFVSPFQRGMPKAGGF
jgi:AAA15 family ATPase/GTPase